MFKWQLKWCFSVLVHYPQTNITRPTLHWKVCVNVVCTMLKKSCFLYSFRNMVTENARFSKTQRFSFPSEYSRFFGDVKDIQNWLDYTISREFWTGLIVPIFKSKNKNSANPSNYRPITLLVNWFKIFESKTKIRLQTFLIKKHLIAPQQAGFQPHGNTLLNMCHCFGKSTGINIWTTYIDIRKAYDTVWRQGWIFKLAATKCSLKSAKNK